LDVEAGPSWTGRKLEVQLLRPATPVPTVACLIEIRCGEIARFAVPLDIEDGSWVVLRLADPEAPNAVPGPPDHPANNDAIAYTSPWFLRP
ncbi:MAG TPA: hypothetical protein VGP04_06120, partial [Pseudonocardiaceae bacterium]|nr:hypothetical protein [Pseudonocardiaceae bacterium]